MSDMEVFVVFPKWDDDHCYYCELHIFKIVGSKFFYAGCTQVSPRGKWTPEDMVNDYLDKSAYRTGNLRYIIWAELGSEMPPQPWME